MERNILTRAAAFFESPPLEKRLLPLLPSSFWKISWMISGRRTVSVGAAPEAGTRRKVTVTFAIVCGACRSWRRETARSVAAAEPWREARSCRCGAAGERRPLTHKQLALTRCHVGAITRSRCDFINLNSEPLVAKHTRSRPGRFGARSTQSSQAGFDGFKHRPATREPVPAVVASLTSR